MIPRILILSCLLSVLVVGCSEERGASELDWRPSLRDALAEASSSRCPVVVAFVAEWSDWCRDLEDKVLVDPRVEEELGKYLLVRVDVEKERELPGRYGVLSFPSILFLDYKGEEYYRIAGFRTADQMVREMAAARKAAGP